MKHDIAYLRWPLILLTALFIAACASMGRPGGGPTDTEPPVFVRSNPAPGALNVNRDRISLYFNENVEVEDPLNQVVISPAQKNVAKVTGVGHGVTVQLQDTLIPNTTYTIDFTNSIKDLNEGNVLEGFSFAFSTGDVLDSLCISGMVFAAENLEPAQSMLVGVHSNLSDTALTKLPFERITRTNQYGQFTIRNLKPGRYRIFAVNDINRDNRWDRSEDIAVFPGIIEPTSKRVMHTDTVFRPNGEIDSVFTHEITEFYPNDLLLTWFNVNYKSQYLSKNERKERNKIYFEMGAPSDTLPELHFVGGPYDGEDFTLRTMLEASPTRDTLTYWIADSDVIMMDSIRIAARYLKTDTLDNLSWTTDTLNFNMRAERKKKDNKKKKEESDSVSAPKIELLRINSSMSNQADIFSRLVLESTEPIRSFDAKGVHFEMMPPKDTLWTPIDPPEFRQPDPYSPRKLTADYKWDYDTKYRLTIDSLSIVGIYDHHNGPFKAEFNIKPESDYGNITFTVTGTGDEPAFVQLLSQQDAPVRTVKVTDGKAEFNDVTPAAYYARLILDRNGNGKWDTGSVTDSVAPEDVFYFPKKINLKKNWDVNQSWDIFETPVDLQKPNEIKKNKPKTKRNQDRNADEEEEDQYYDEFGNPAVDPDDPFGKRKNNRNYNRNNRNNSTRNGLPGINGIGGGTLRTR